MLFEINPRDKEKRNVVKFILSFVFLYVLNVFNILNYFFFMRKLCSSADYSTHAATDY